MNVKFIGNYIDQKMGIGVHNTSIYRVQLY